MVPERGRGTRPLSFFFLALTLALAGVFSSPPFAIVDTPEVFSPVSASREDGGVANGSRVGSTSGHAAPLESTNVNAPCRMEAGAPQECSSSR